MRSLKIFQASVSNVFTTYLIILNPHVCIRPKWIIHMGVKYTFTEYVLIGWQDDDLPAFGQIQYIVVIEGIVLFTVTEYHTLSIDWHFHSCVINRSDKVELCSLSELVYYHPFRAHNLNGHQYITFHSHIKNVFSV